MAARVKLLLIVVGGRHLLVFYITHRHGVLSLKLPFQRCTSLGRFKVRKFEKPMGSRVLQRQALGHYSSSFLVVSLIGSGFDPLNVLVFN